jgi:hypothetical protein
MSIYKETFNNYLSGCISGVSAILVSHPIDTIKTNYQENIKVSYSLKTLYRGITAPIIGVGLEKALVFGTYDLVNNKCNNHAISGAIAGFTASFVVTPYERIKILLQTSSKPGTISFTSFVSERQYIKYLFNGLSSTFYREVPGFAIYFSLYNMLKDYSIKQNGSINPGQSFLYGGLSGAISWVFIYPQDRIKTHIQSQVDNKISIRDSIKYVLRDGGICGLYKGFHLALLRAIPLHATAFMVNEICKSYFD